MTEVKYRIKDDEAVWSLIHKLSEKYACKPHMTVFNEDFLGQPRYCAVRFSAYDKDNLEKATNEFKLEVNKIKTARQLGKEYVYESLDIVKNENVLSGKVVVPAFSKIKPLPKFIAESLELKCSVVEKKENIFSNKTVSFEVKGSSENLDCFKKLCEHFLVSEKARKKRKIF